jgi:hypothetical protein
MLLGNKKARGKLGGIVTKARIILKEHTFVV